MIKLTFQTQEEYFDFVQNALVFTHLRAYNAAAFIWKQEDVPFIQKVDDENYRKENFEEWRKCVQVLTNAEKEYGEERRKWNDIFSTYEFATLLESFGFIYESYNLETNEGTSIEEDINVDITKLEHNEYFPKTFPCVACMEHDNVADLLDVMFVYISDFEEKSPKLNFSWLKQNALDFWTKGKGIIYGN